MWHISKTTPRIDSACDTTPISDEYSLSDVSMVDKKMVSLHQYLRCCCKRGINGCTSICIHQIAPKPTRAGNNLDLYFTSNPSLIKNVAVAPGISDHDMVIVDSDIRPTFNKPKPRTVYKFAQANWEEITKATEDFCTKFAADFDKFSVEENWSCFKKFAVDLLNERIPTKLTTSRYNLPWFSKALGRLVRKKQELYNRANQSHKPAHWAEYREIKKRTERALKRARWAHLKDTLTESLAEGNSKPFWAYVKRLRRDNVGVSPIRSGGVLHSDAGTKAELLNQQFQSVFTHEDENQAIPDLPGPKTPNINPLTITARGIEKLLLRLNEKKAIGPDQIPNQFLKHAAKPVSEILQLIFTQSLSTGILPRDWRDANISPVFKKDDRNAAVNYRPVSLTSVSCKILEHIIVKHLLDHFEQHHVLTNRQHGFRSGLSCETQLITTTFDLLKSFDGGGRTDMAVLDFSKAFDTVPHRRLMSKLSHYGVEGEIHAWIRHFLQDRTKQVVVDGVRSRFLMAF